MRSERLNCLFESSDYRETININAYMYCQKPRYQRYKFTKTCITRTVPVLHRSCAQRVILHQLTNKNLARLEPFQSLHRPTRHVIVLYQLTNKNLARTTGTVPALHYISWLVFK